jgi:FMN reductase
MSPSSTGPATSVVAIVCSPGGSRTAQHASLVLAGAASAGAEPAQLDCRDGRVDEQSLKVIEGADALLFAAPTYRGQAAWPLKALLDNIPRNREGNSALRGKAAGTLLTADSHHHFLGVESTRSILCDFFGMQVLSPHLYVSRSDLGGTTGEPRIAEQCRAYGAALTDLARWLATSAAVRKLHPMV